MSECKTCGDTARWVEGNVTTCSGCGSTDVYDFGRVLDVAYREVMAERALADTLRSVEHMTPDELREAQRCGLVGEA